MPIIDAHVHLGQDSAHGFALTRDELLDAMNAAGVDLALAAPFPGSGDMSRNNEALSASLGGPILGVGQICPESVEAPAEAQRIANEYNMAGALIDVEATFEYFLAHGLISTRTAATFECLQDLGLPVFLHVHHPLQRFLTADLAVGLDVLLRAYPRMTIIASTRIPALSLVQHFPNLVIETSLDTASPVDLAGALHAGGAHRVMFASLSPIEHPLVKRMAFERLDSTDEERTAVFGGNAQRLFNLALPTRES
jgi:predicted TIM-barrel fold metal-dependent hydrolase